MTNHKQRFDFLARGRRKGVSLLWLIISFPALMLFLIFAVEIGNIWLARLELEQSLEANALAAVKEWAESPDILPITNPPTKDTLGPRIVGNNFSKANPVRGRSVDLTNTGLNPAFDNTLNYNTSQPNDNDVRTNIDNLGAYNQTGVLVFGAITQFDGPPGTSVVFNSDVVPNCTPVAPILSTPYAVRAQATIQVDSVVSAICGIPLGPWGVSAKSTAYYDCGTGDAKLIRVDVFQGNSP